MKKRIINGALFVLLSCAVVGQGAAGQENAANAEVIKLVQAGMPDTLIMAKIRELRPSLDRSADSLIALRGAGASAAVLEMMFEVEIALNRADAAAKAGFPTDTPVAALPAVEAIPAGFTPAQNAGDGPVAEIAPMIPPGGADVAAIPAKPVPPAGAAISTQIPPMGADGVLTTPNRNLTPDENVWHFRAAMNVAALNCIGPAWSPIAAQYNRMLEAHKASLARNNLAVDALFRKRHGGAAGLRIRDTKMTELFNYFALPPVREEFCNAALTLSQEASMLAPEHFPAFATSGLQQVDAHFVKFFIAFTQYQTQLQEWNAKYAVTAPVNSGR